MSRLSGLRYADVYPLRVLGGVLAASLVSAIPVLLLKATGLLAFWPILAAASLAFGVIYALTLWRFGVLKSGEKESVRALGLRLAALGGFSWREAVGGRPR